MKKYNDKLYVIQCDCHSELLAIQVYDDPTDTEAYLSIFKHFNAHDISFWGRIKYCFRILKNGSPFYDQICLDIHKIRALKQMCSEIENEFEKREHKLSEEEAYKNRSTEL